MRLIRSFLIAFSTYSRIPVPQAEWTEENRRYAMCFFPLVGAALGLILWGWLALSDVLHTDILIRGAVAALPGRVAVDCAACGGNAAAISEVIRKEVHTMLNELADYKYDTTKYDELVRDRMKWESRQEDDDDE